MNFCDIYNFLKSCSENYLTAVGNFVCSNRNNKLCIFSSILRNEEVWFGFEFTKWPKNTLHGGFRTLKSLGFKMLMSRTRSQKIKRFLIERLDQKRLFNRVGTKLDKRLPKTSICLIGCGSIGSNLAFLLAKSGITNFSFIDNDKLHIENVARHICSSVDASKSPPKAKILSKLIKNQFPFIDCKSYTTNVLELLFNDENILNEYDLIITAVANGSVERRLNKLACERKIKKPIIYMWLEPYGLAGHMLYIDNNHDGCYNCCNNSNGNYKFSVAVENNAYKVQEAGCQCTFLPYSYIDTIHFVSIVSRNILNIIQRKPKSNFRFTWVGDKKIFREKGFEVNESWASISSFSCFSKEITKDINCSICGN